MSDDPFIHQQIFAYCDICKKLVTVVPLFTKLQAMQAFQTGAGLDVMHTAASGHDHRWPLDKRDRESLRKALSRGDT